jgi:hypothetical protein
MNRPDTDSHRVQTTRRNDESHTVEQGTLARREFIAVRVPMEDSKEANHYGSHRQGRADLEHHSGAQ